jgi:sterol desaturase/sphingolipid hydroxylase (fatty acid hydroxylase superfamily)
MGMTDTFTPPSAADEPNFRWDSALSAPPLAHVLVPPPAPGALQTTPPPPQRPETSTLRRGLGILGHIMFVVGGVALSLQIDSGVMTAVVVLFVILAPFEKLYPRQKGQKWRRPLAANDISFALMNPLLNVVGGTAFILIGVLSLFWVPGLALRPLVAMIPGWALPFVAFALFDFLGYWTHRWAHEVPFLWRFHAVHHSPEHMDWASGFRIHPFDGVLIGPAVLFLLAAGFDAELTGVLAVVQIILGLGFHANVRVRWRRLDRVLANPEFHHWHHANEPDSIGHNYAPGLPLWDQIFGTFFMPKHTSGRRPQNYGINEYLPRNMVGQLSYPLRGARQHLHLWRHPIRATKLAFRGLRKLLGDVWTKTRRPTHSVRRETMTGSSSTNSSLFEKTPPSA